MNLTSPHQTLRRWGASALWCLSALSATSWAQVNAPNAAEASSGGYFTTPGNGPTRGGSQLGGPQLDGQDTQPGGDTLPLAPRLGTNTQIMNGSNLSKPGSTEPPSAPDARQDSAAPLPSEFQKFVAASTGRKVPVFGASFFASGRGAGGLDNVPVSSDYMVGPGDELLIRAWGAIDVDYRATIDRNGQITLPKVGTFTVSGTKASGLEKHLRAQIGRFFTNFQLSVALGQLRGLSVFVVGPAYKSGVYRLPSQSTLMSAVVAAGGPGANGSMRKISLRRSGQVVSELDMYSFLVSGDTSKDLQLANGDVVVFQPTGPQVALYGAVDTPAIFELQQAQEPVETLLRYAGNLSVLANPHSAQLERIDPRQPRQARSVETIRLEGEGLAKALRNGDVLQVLPISPAFANAVTLRGYVAEPLRHAYRPGMRVLDLIPDTQTLVSFDFYRRTNLLTQVIKEPDETTKQMIVKPTQPTPRLEEVNWDYATVERLDLKDLSPQVIPFHLGKALLQGDPTQNLTLQPGDVVTIYSKKDIRGPMARQTRLVSVEGEVMSPGVYQLNPGETLRGLLNRAGGFTPQAYVYGLELSREETRQRQRENLQAALTRLEALGAAQTAQEASRTADGANTATMSANERARRVQLASLAKVEPNGRIALELLPDTQRIDDLPDLPLENSDRVVVPSRPGFVTVAGAVSNSNAYLWKPGRTVDDYVKLAGLEETSDRSNMFILRADGTVKHAHDQSRFLGMGGIESQKLYPGDAVVVPNQLDYESWGRALVRNLKDWSQIFYQFGLGAAAIQTFKN